MRRINISQVKKRLDSWCVEPRLRNALGGVLVSVNRGTYNRENAAQDLAPLASADIDVSEILDEIDLLNRSMEINRRAHDLRNRVSHVMPTPKT